MTSKGIRAGLQQNLLLSDWKPVSARVYVCLPVYPFICTHAGSLSLSYCQVDLVHSQLSATVLLGPRRMSQRLRWETERWGGNKAPGPAGTLGKDPRCPEELFTKFCHMLCDISLLSARVMVKSTTQRMTYHMESVWGKGPEAGRSPWPGGWRPLQSWLEHKHVVSPASCLPRGPGS